MAEHVQQEKAEQTRLEREEQRARAEVERLKGEIKEVERKQRELKEVELRRLAQERDQLEVEKWVEEQHRAQLRGVERAVEWREQWSGGGRHWWCRGLLKLARVVRHLGILRGV